MAFSGSTAAAPPRKSPDVQPYALTLSGGVSLGSYMAGLNWAMIEMLRRDLTGDNPDLIGVTGASAGGINALLSAMRWCEDDALVTQWLAKRNDENRRAPDDAAYLRIQRNLFAATWLAVDLRDLLPAEEAEFAGLDDPREDPDSMLSRRKAYKPVIDEVAHRLERPIYRAACSIKLGLTVTRTRPRTLNISGISVGNQRFVIPLEATVDNDNRLSFRLDTAAAESGRSDLLGNLLFLTPEDADQMRVDSGVVVRAAQASSAFPVALGPVELRHCVPSSQCTGRVDSWADDVCSAVRFAVKGEERYVACAEPFVDGGVFDNVPLGVAMAQIESSPRLQGDVAKKDTPEQSTPRSLRPYRPLRYLYVEYGNRRKPGNHRHKEAAHRRGPLRETLEAIGGFVETASDYELHNVLRYNTWNESATALLAREVADLVEQAPADRRNEALEGGSCEVGPPIECVQKVLHDVDKIKLGAVELATALRGTADEIERALLAPPAAEHALAATRESFEKLERTVLQAIVRLCTPDEAKGFKTWLVGRELCDGRERGRRLASQARALLEGEAGRELLVTTRLSPLAGTHATHFAALLDLPLREYDFYAGIYDAIWNQAEMACDIEQRLWVVNQFADARKLGWRRDHLRHPRAARSAEDQRPPWPGRAACLEKRVEVTRRALGVQSGAGLGGVILDALVQVEREHRYGHPTGEARPTVVGGGQRRAGEPNALRVMRALFDPRRCPRAERTMRNVCLADLGFQAFAESLERHGYRPGTAFMEWALDHPGDDEWWLLPASYATARIQSLSRAESNPGLSTMSTVARLHVESVIDDVDRNLLVAPSSLPDRLGRGWGLFFPFLALSVHPMRRVELGVLRGGLRVNDIDLLLDASLRVMVVPPPHDQEDDLGYGLFTRGFTALTASFAPTYRFGGTVFSTLALRGGVPVREQPLKSNGPWEEEVSFELVLTMFDGKFRAAVGCHPWEAEPRDGCWRHPYYSFGVNDLLAVGYWAGINPFQSKRFIFPFVAPRFAVSADPEAGRDQAVELGLLRGGWGRGDGPGFDIDLSAVFPAFPADDAPDATFDASAALLWRFSYAFAQALGLRVVMPLTIQNDARFNDANLESFLVSWRGIRAAVGWFPDPIEDEAGLDLPAWYVSLGLDFDRGPAADWW